ncbi:MAG: M20/M25/M40 family metallo-hydrolase [Desulfobacteraceae bacterium]|nr:MAG: M20/M25/M40 family metallo-hydrolase [Desulfobacteraceae bacterium]
MANTCDSRIFEHPAELLQALIRFDTTNPPGNEAGCVSYIKDLLTEAGFETAIIAKEPDRPNLIARLKGSGSAPPLLLYGHADVVTTSFQEWAHPPFEAKNIDGYIWGRGALDMKGGLAMMLSALLRTKAGNFIPAGDIVLAVVSDEEAGGDIGAKYLVENHPEQFAEIRYAVGEFGGYSQYTGNKKFYPIQIAEKQACWMKATFRGQGGHGSIPVSGGSMPKLARFISAIERHKLPVHVTSVVKMMIETIAANLPFPKGMIFRQLLNPFLTDAILKLIGDTGKKLDPLLHNTVSATIVKGGEKINVIPGEITLHIDGRLLPGFKSDDMLAELRKIAGNDFEIELIRYEPQPCEPDTGLFDTLADILRDADPGCIPMPLLMPGITDGRHFSRLGIQTYGFLPMNLPKEFKFLETIHAADERIPKEAVAFGADAIFELLRRYGKKTDERVYS